MRFQIGTPLCRGAPEFGSSSRSLSIDSSAAATCSHTKSHVKRKLASWLSTGEPSNRIGKSLATWISIQSRLYIPGGDSNCRVITDLVSMTATAMSKAMRGLLRTGVVSVTPMWWTRTDDNDARRDCTQGLPPQTDDRAASDRPTGSA